MHPRGYSCSLSVGKRHRFRTNQKDQFRQQRARELPQTAWALGILPAVGPVANVPKASRLDETGAPPLENRCRGLGAGSTEEAQMMHYDGSHEETMKQLRSFKLGGYDGVTDYLI